MAPLNIAVIGMGRMGQIYAQTLHTSVVGARLFAVVEANPEALARARALFAPPHALTSVDEALALPGLDAVVIASPTSTHAAIVTAAADAGKAIFCEKPLALTLADTHAALAAVSRARVPLQVGFMRRFDAAYQRAATLIADGRIGTPVTFKAIGRDPFCPDPAFADPTRSGGLILDMGIHDFDLARWLMGAEVERVSAEGTLLVCDTLRAVGDIDNACINLRFTSGALGNVELSRNAFYGYDIRTEVLGSAGAVLVGRHQHLPVVLLTREGAQTDVAPYLQERFGPAYQAQLQHFVECVQQGRDPAVGGADALAAFRIGLAATHSARQSGTPVNLAEFA
ncbi:MAG: scyllo-inositol 2-dehydrogenase [Chloroflexi bacterium OHK40]|jgi:inositol 2-dehydrogenase